MRAKIEQAREELKQLYVEHPFETFLTLVAERLALLTHPAPDREALERTIRETLPWRILGILDEPIYGKTLSESWMTLLLTAVMAWAAPQRELRWCEHIKLGTESPPRWTFQDLGGREITDWNGVWKRCPICEAPRPE